MTEQQVRELILDFESDRVERTTSFREDKLGPAVCAFANDFPNHRSPGYILLGVNDDGSVSNRPITDEHLQQIGNIKSNGNVLPQPSLKVSPIFKIDGGEVVVLEVQPSSYPPVRYDGRCWIRVGPRKARASQEEERILTERRASYAKTYDLVPALGATLDDISTELFKTNYLQYAIDQETLNENNRNVQEQLSSLRFFDMRQNCPTHAGILIFGLNPEFYLPGAYLQYVKFKGIEMDSEVDFEKKFTGALITELRQLDDFVKHIIIQEKLVKKNSFQEQRTYNYPYWALRELVLNAVMHRSYESNAPTYIYEFSNRIEIINSGGLFGEVTPTNFPNASDYRNVVLAEALKVLGYVNKFNYGVKRAIAELIRNGNGQPDFDLSLTTKFKVTIPINPYWL
ncbi:MAG: RNA-binding domain-containing protein [Runella sp.]